MARPFKAGLDYFPLDVNLDEKIELIEAKHGLLGFGLIIKLFQNIYKNGYYIDASEERLLLLKKKLGIDLCFIIEAINDACRWNVFNEKLFEKYKILTSCGIQKRFIEATKRRKEVEFIKEYLCVEHIESLYKDDVNVSINKINANINGINTSDGTQSKVKKSKVKKSKESKPPDFSKFYSEVINKKITNPKRENLKKTILANLDKLNILICEFCVRRIQHKDISEHWTENAFKSQFGQLLKLYNDLTEDELIKTACPKTISGFIRNATDMGWKGFSSAINSFRAKHQESQDRQTRYEKKIDEGNRPQPKDFHPSIME